MANAFKPSPHNSPPRGLQKILNGTFGFLQKEIPPGSAKANAMTALICASEIYATHKFDLSNEKEEKEANGITSFFKKNDGDAARGLVDSLMVGGFCF